MRFFSYVDFFTSKIYANIFFYNNCEQMFAYIFLEFQFNKLQPFKIFGIYELEGKLEH